LVDAWLSILLLNVFCDELLVDHRGLFSWSVTSELRMRLPLFCLQIWVYRLRHWKIAISSINSQTIFNQLLIFLSNDVNSWKKLANRMRILLIFTRIQSTIIGLLLTSQGKTLILSIFDRPLWLEIKFRLRHNLKHRLSILFALRIIVREAFGVAVYEVILVDTGYGYLLGAHRV